MTLNTPEIPVTAALKGADYLRNLIDRGLLNNDAKAVANALASEDPDSDCARSVLAAAIEGNRISSLDSLALKYSKLKDMLCGPLSPAMTQYPNDTFVAASLFAGLTAMQQRIFALWSSGAGISIDSACLVALSSEVDIGALCDALWSGAPVRERATRIRELIEKAPDQYLVEVLESGLEVLSLADAELGAEKRRKFLALLNKSASPAIMRELIAHMGGLDTASRKILQAYPTSGSCFSHALESFRVLPEGLEEFASLRPTNIVTGQPEATCAGYVIVATTPGELVHAKDFATERNRYGFSGSLIYQSANPVSGIELESLNKTFESVAINYEDINWYLEDPEQRARHDDALGALKQVVNNRVRGLVGRAPGVEAYFNHIAEQKLFNGFNQAASIWRILSTKAVQATQMIFMNFETALGFLEKCSSGGLLNNPLQNELSGVAFLGASPSPQTGINPHNFVRYNRYKRALSDSSGGEMPKENADIDKSQLRPIQASASGKARIAVFLHPHDQQYLYTIQAIAKKLPATDYEIFTSRACTSAEAEVLEGIAHTPLMDAVLQGTQPRSNPDYSACGRADENIKLPAITAMRQTLEQFNIFDEIDANIDGLLLFEEQFAKFFRERNYTHALFIPERPAIFKLATRVIEQAGIVCANVETSIFGDEPILGDFLAPQHFVVDPTQKEILRCCHCVDEASIHIGGPAHYYARGLEPQRFISKDVFAGRRNILLCTQSDNFEKNVSLIDAAIKSLEGSALVGEDKMTLVIRPHPNESETRRRAYKDLPTVVNRSDVEFCEKSTFEQSVKSARFVITRYSTALYDARNDFAIPIAVNLSNDPASIDFIGLGVCLGARTVEELTQYLLPRNAQDVLDAENSFRKEMKSGIDDPARHILESIGVPVRSDEGGI